MTIALKDAMYDILDGWREDLSPTWRSIFAETKLGFDDMDLALMLEPWEPVFPARRDQTFLGAPKTAHIFRAFDRIAPDAVTTIVLGQDPYPCPAFATGRAFEAGNVAGWRELEKMFSTSVRTFVQLIAAARTGDPCYARSTEGWDRLIHDIEAGNLDMEPAEHIADRWVDEGALLLNSSFTISRFAVEGDPHQLRGHLPLWRPLLLTVLRYLIARNSPIVVIGFGDQAASTLVKAGINQGKAGNVGCILREHPAFAESVFALENPFVASNRMLTEMGGAAVSW